MQQSHENELLLKSVKSVMEKEIYPFEEQVDKDGCVPDELGKHIEEKAIEIGLYAANLPEKVGGGGLDYSGMALLEREFGKTSHALHSWIGRPTEILLACQGDQIENYLTPCVKAEKRELFALTEPEAGSDIMSMKSNAKKDRNDWILNGSKHFISGPCLPDFAIVFASTGEDTTPRGKRKRITAFLVDVGEKGFDIDEAIGLLHAARGLNIIGGDVVCMMPTKDSPNQITSMVAAAVMFEMIAMIAENVKTSSGQAG